MLVACPPTIPISETVSFARHNFKYKELIPILVDQKVYENEESAFNMELKTASVKISTQEMKIVFEKAEAREGSFTK